MVVVADAPPISPIVNPAAPNAGTAAFVTRFLWEACFTRGIVASSIPLEREERSVFESTLRIILRLANMACKAAVLRCEPDFVISVAIHLDER